MLEKKVEEMWKGGDNKSYRVKSAYSKLLLITPFNQRVFFPLILKIKSFIFD